ncbi:HAMP domain-containing sensor histidine kinase [Candidatus Solirubrobacter pratensis]|uniref:HAMP domain-containing sensor histidine kinase n=1 Tax=Candidatus Solirubrobacter pratensis TaxID=1298857 RepID=UPI00040A3179|nr:HAMP domain-containing sensor histidine kinase [Candidatus Solirubrobacter pratensis]
MGALSLRARLLLALAYVLVLAVGALLVPLVRSVRDRVGAEVRTQALAQADAVAAVAGASPDDLSAAIAGRPAPDLDVLVSTSARTSRGRVVVVGPDGRVIADSSPGSIGADFSSRPEIAGALRRRVVQEERPSATLNQRLLATAVPIRSAPGGAVRVTQSVAAVSRAVDAATVGLVLIGVVVLGLGLAAGALLAASVVRPMRRLAAAARRAGEGDLGVRVPEEGAREQRELGRAFNDMTARVQRMVDAQQAFVADASHQLRTPLAGLRLRLEEAAAEAGEGPARAQVDGALGEVDRLSGILTELLVLSEAGAARAPDAAVDPLRACRRAATRWSGHDARVVVEGGDGAAVRCAAADLDRILDVLIENALAYGPAGQTIALTADAGRITVADEGPGLAGGEEESVFNRFHRGSAGRAVRGGTGLGLAIARELASRWEGTVTLANGTAGGAVATVTLPLVTAPVLEAAP